MTAEPRDSHGIPLLGLGTYGRTGEAGVAAILEGIALGYRHIDTAQTYDTEWSVGEAIRRSGLPRDEFFVTTKVTDAKLARADFLPSIRKSLETLGLDRIDLTLIHWPSSRDQVPFEHYMGDLAEAKALGLTRLIGVSNFTIALIDKAMRLLGPGGLATNQVELHPYLQSRRLTAACTAHGITVTAYMPLAKGKVAGDPVLMRIGARHGVPAASVSLAWLLQSGRIVIPASSRVEHMRANRAALGLMLTPDEMAEIAGLDRGERMINPTKAPAWDNPP
jgi:2,5-diketo-D-gluconate reductase B